jgi:hypothetical protein
MFEKEILENKPIILEKIDEALEKGRGYYELKAQKSNEILVLRFNLKAFRNNYSLLDITKMDLLYFAVKVGKMNISDLDAENEFKIKNNLGSDELADRINQNSCDVIGLYADSNDIVDVYDVVLAGIQQ